MLLFQVATTLAVVFAAFVPLFKLRPRRLLDAAALAQQRVPLAMVALAAVGYFDYRFALPRLTLVHTAGLLLVAVRLWFLFIRKRLQDSENRVLIVGDGPERMADVLRATELPILGYVAPPLAVLDIGRVPLEATNGGV